MAFGGRTLSHTHCQAAIFSSRDKLDACLAIWPNLQRQQDAGEFMAVLLTRAASPAYAGTWSARRFDHDGVQVLDAGTLQAPLPIAAFFRTALTIGKDSVTYTPLSKQEA